MLNLLLAVAVAPQVAFDLQSALASAVDLAEPADRAKAARELASRKDVTLDQWLQAAGAFQPIPMEWEPGRQRVEVPLEVQGSEESTELWLYFPKDYRHDVAAPLIVALHGAGGRGADILQHWMGVADATGAAILAPSEAGPNQGSTGKPRERRSVLEAIRWTRRRVNVDENRIWLTGYSRGGNLCWDLALRFPGIFAAAAPQAGGPRINPVAGTNNMRFLDNLTDTPLRAMVGSEELPGLQRSLKMFIERAAARDIESLDLVTIPGRGHLFDPTTGRGWPEWFESKAREPWPKTVVRQAARKDETSNSWITIESFHRDVKEEPRLVLRTKPGDPPLDERTKWIKVLDLMEESTARVKAEFLGEGRFRLTSERATTASLLLQRGWTDAKGKIRVEQGTKSRTYAAKPSAKVLLEVFVERFDRTFLPVARAKVRLEKR